MTEETALQPDEQAKNTPVEETGDETTYNWKKLLALSTWAGVLSWGLLLVYVINFGFAIYYDYQQLAGQSLTWIQLVSLLPRLASLFLGFFYFILLQAVSEGINLLLEADDKISRLLER
jgi:hypothetical protein